MHSVRFSIDLVSCRHRAGADPDGLDDRVRRTARSPSLPGAATDHAQLQHAGQHAQAVVDDGRRHPLPRLAAGIGRRRIAAAQCGAACRPLPSKRGANSRPEPAASRQAGDAPEAARAQAEPEPVTNVAPRRSRSPRSRRLLSLPRARQFPSRLRPDRRCRSCPSAPLAPSPRLLPLLRLRPSARPVRPPLLPRRTPRARPRSATSFARSSPASSSTAWSRASPTATRSSRSTRRAAASSRCGCRKARRANAPRTCSNICARSTPTASIRRTIRCRGSTSAARRRRREAELKFTETLLTYARHAMTGRVHFSRVSPNIDYKLAFDADDVLKKIAASNDLPATLGAVQSAATGLHGAQGQARGVARRRRRRERAGPHRATARCCATPATARARRP